MTLEGNTGAPKRLWVKARQPGGAPCAPSAASDSGRALTLSGDESELYLTEYTNVADYYGVSVNGNFAIAQAGRWTGPVGPLMFCFWLAPNSGDAAAPFTQVVTFRQSSGSVSPSISPLGLLTKQNATVTVSGSTEAPGDVWAKVRPAGGSPCAPTFTADTGQELVEGADVEGAFSQTAPFSTETPGEYLLCAWLTHRDSSEMISGPQPSSFTVTKPCVVPKVKAGSTVTQVTTRLKTAGCSAGAWRRKASRKYSRGRIIGLDERPGTSLASGSPVGLVVSAGPPCLVPKVKSGVRLGSAKAQLRAAGCRPGKVRFARSSRPRGTVVRFAPRSGARLAPRAKVVILLARR
jgi:hypothetical protein